MFYLSLVGIFSWEGISFEVISDSLAERSKAPDSSSGGAILVGSNPTAVRFCFFLILRRVSSWLRFVRGLAALSRSN